MTDNLKDIIRQAFQDDGKLCSPVYLYGGHADEVLTMILIGFYLLRLREPFYSTNGFQIMNYGYFRVDKAIEMYSKHPGPGVLAIKGAEMLRKIYFSAREEVNQLLEKILGTVHDNGGQVLISSECPPEELLDLDEAVIKKLSAGIVYQISDDKEIGSPVEELMAMGLLHAREKGRYAAFYEDRFLDLFPVTKTEELSQAQTDALAEMNELARDKSMKRQFSFIDGYYRKLNQSVPVEDWDVDLLAFETCYPFWNRFNCDEEGYEVDFAKSGRLGSYLRLLKEKDS